MTQTLTTAFAGLVFLSVLSPALVAAQTPPSPFGQQGGAGRRAAPQFNPNEGLQANGCVKLCPLDTNPCDPPEFKRADGRCNLKD